MRFHLNKKFDSMYSLREYNYNLRDMTASLKNIDI
jgi:hypothetical protein